MKNDKELVRYDPDYAVDFRSITTAYMKSNAGGEYVLYSQAAEIIAAKDNEISKMNVYNSSYRNQILELREFLQAAEAKLAQIKKQNIENLSDLISKKMIKSAEEISDTWANDLMYGNNEDDDSNSGLSSVLSGKEQS